MEDKQQDRRVRAIYEDEMTTNTIYHGDSLQVLKTLPDESIDCCVTSPPYNKHTANRKCRANDTWVNANISYGDFKDNLPEDIYQKQQRDIIQELVRIIKPTGSIFYNHKIRIKNHRTIIPTEWLSDFNIRQVLVWDRMNSPQLSPIRWFPSTEYIYWITKANIQPKFYKRSKHQMEVLRIPPKPYKNHPAPFPEELVEALMINTTDAGDIVVDPFAGSGTTCVVAKRLERNYIGIELNPAYIKLAEERIAKEKTLFNDHHS